MAFGIQLSLTPYEARGRLTRGMKPELIRGRQVYFKEKVDEKGNKFVLAYIREGKNVMFLNHPFANKDVARKGMDMYLRELDILGSTRAISMNFLPGPSKNFPEMGKRAQPYVQKPYNKYVQPHVTAIVSKIRRKK